MRGGRDSIEVWHGKLRVQAPRSLFAPDGSIDEEEGERFRAMLSSRYPWLSERSLDELMEKARQAMEGLRQEEMRGAPMGRELAAEDPAKAVAYLKDHLESFPEDGDAWYALGEALCRDGRREEGYRAFRRARSL